MDLNEDSRTLSTHTTVDGQAGEQELSLSSTHCEIESDGTILLQLLEFKTHLLEAVEELHILRDSKTRFEDQLSKLVLEKQELEWEKESLQQQIETVANQNKDSLSNVKKQFQAKIRNTEEEKWKYQLSAELKDKEINNLKEELKSLQLLKYNLEKKSSELEQKLALQSRSKDSHLNQLGKVEKRFTALSRQCTVIKQAHVKLEQNVNEAMSINRKLCSTNEKQEATIVSLKKELEEVNKRLIKVRMMSVTHDKIHSSTGKEQHMQQWQQKLKTETEINKKLCKENESVRTEKQEVMKALQHAEHLLLDQTQTVSRVDLELQTQREHYQALKNEHEMMREKSKALEDKVAKLMESYAASRTSWDKEKTVFLGLFKNEQQEHQAVKEAYNALCQKHNELSLLHKAQAQQIYELEMRDSSQVLSVSTQVFPSLVEKSLNEPIPTSELQPVTPSLTKHSHCPEDTDAVEKPVTTGATGEQEALNHNQQSQYQQPLNHSNLFRCPTFHQQPSDSRTGTCTNIPDELTCNPKKSDPVTITHLSFNSSLVPESNQDHKTVYGSVDLVNNDKYENGDEEMKGNIITGEDGCKQQKNNYKKDRNTEQQWNREQHLRGGLNGEKKETLRIKTADRQEDNKGSAEDEGDDKNRYKVVGQTIDGVEETGKTAAHTSETQIQDQRTTDRTKSSQQQVVDFMDTEPTQTISEASDFSQSISVTVMDTGFSHVSKERGDLRDEQLPHPVIQEAQDPCCFEVETQDANLHQFPKRIHQVPAEMTAEAQLCKKSTADLTTECSETLNESSKSCTQKDTAPLVTKADVTVGINTAPTVPMGPPGITSNVKQINVTEEGLTQETGQQESLVTDANSSKSKRQSNMATQENSTCQSVQDPVSSTLEDMWPSSMMNNIELEPEVDSSSFQATMSDISPPQPFYEGTELNSTSSNEKHPFSTKPMFLKSKHNKVPLVIARASELLNASSVCGTAASSSKYPQGQRKASGETCRDTTAADTESRGSLWMSSFPPFASSSKVSWQASTGSSKGQTSAVGFVSDPSCSQAIEDQQSSFRAHISKIEQFLSKERLCLPKRQKNDN